MDSHYVRRKQLISSSESSGKATPPPTVENASNQHRNRLESDSSVGQKASSSKKENKKKEPMALKGPPGISSVVVGQPQFRILQRPNQPTADMAESDRAAEKPRRNNDKTKANANDDRAKPATSQWNAVNVNQLLGKSQKLDQKGEKSKKKTRKSERKQADMRRKVSDALLRSTPSPSLPLTIPESASMEPEEISTSGELETAVDVPESVPKAVVDMAESSAPGTSSAVADSGHDMQGDGCPSEEDFASHPLSNGVHRFKSIMVKLERIDPKKPSHYLFVSAYHHDFSARKCPESEWGWPNHVNAILPSDVDRQTLNHVLVLCSQVVYTHWNAQKPTKKKPGELVKEPLSQVSLPYLTSETIHPLKRKADRFPMAVYFCRLCDYHLDSVQHCRRHITNSEHAKKRREQAVGDLLRSLPSPTVAQCRCVGAECARIVADTTVSPRRLLHCANLAEQLTELVRTKLHPECFVRLYGSCATSLALLVKADWRKSSDVNLELVYPAVSLRHSDALSGAFVALSEASTDFDGVVKCFDEFWPYVRFRQKDGMDELGMDCVLSVGNGQAHDVAQLIRAYVEIDPMVPLLARLTRHWAKECQLDSLDLGGCPTYVFDLMVIHFLQQKRYIPVLHELETAGMEAAAESEFDPKAYATNKKIIADAMYHLKSPFLGFDKDGVPSMSQGSSNSSEFTEALLGELWLGFLRFFAVEIDHHSAVVQIRKQQLVTKEEKSWTRKRIAVEDPFLLSKNLCGHVNQQMFDYFTDCLRTTYEYFGVPRTHMGPLFSAQLGTLKLNNQGPVEEEQPVIPSRSYDRRQMAEIRTRTEHLHASMIDMAIRQRLEEFGVFVERPTQKGRTESAEMEDAFTLIPSCSPSPPAHSARRRSGKQTVGNRLKRLSAQSSPASTCVSASEVSVVESETRLSASHEGAAVVDRTDERGDTSRSASNAAVSPEVSEKESACLVKHQSAGGQQTDSVTDEVGRIAAAVESLSVDDFSYRFSSANFSTLKPPAVCCGYCSAVGHTKPQCPDRRLPPLIHLADDPFADPLHHQFVSSCLDIVPKFTALSPAMESRREDVDNTLRQLLGRLFGFDVPLRLDLFGSSRNGFGFDKSDMDFCLRFSEEQLPQWCDARATIRRIARALRKDGRFADVTPVTNAKVPIVKFRQRIHNIDGDISLYNVLALRNTKLLWTYTQCDPRVVPVGVLVKHWAKGNDIGDASKGSLSSYAYILMLIHYLQRTTPPVLPILQEAYETPVKPTVVVDEWDTYFQEDVTFWKSRDDWQKNHSSIAQLLLGFFRYFSEYFDFDHDVIQIRQNLPLSKFEKRWTDKPLTIEDPFDLNHNLAAGLSKRMFNYVQCCVIRAREVFGDQRYASEVYRLFQYNMSSGRKGQFQLLCEASDNLFERTMLSEAPPADRQCHFCRQLGHFAERCPKLARNALDNESDSDELEGDVQQQGALKTTTTSNEKEEGDDGFGRPPQSIIVTTETTNAVATSSRVDRQPKGSKMGIPIVKPRAIVKGRRRGDSDSTAKGATSSLTNAAAPPRGEAQRTYLGVNPPARSAFPNPNSLPWYPQANSGGIAIGNYTSSSWPGTQEHLPMLLPHPQHVPLPMFVNPQPASHNIWQQQPTLLTPDDYATTNAYTLLRQQMGVAQPSIPAQTANTADRRVAYGINIGGNAVFPATAPTERPQYTWPFMPTHPHPQI